MTDERWKDIIATIKERFTVLDEGTEPLDPGPGSLEFIEFKGPMGEMQLTRTTRPRVLGKKALASKRIGGSASVEYQYSDTEQVHEFTAYRLDPGTGDWEPLAVEPERLQF